MISRRSVLWIFLLSGASALVYQVIWARQLGLVFGNTTISVAIVLTSFMAGLALGAAAAGRLLVQRSNPLRAYAVIEGAIGAYALAFGVLVRAMEALYPTLFSDATSVLALTVFRAAGCFALLLIPTTLMGATLPLLTESLHRLDVGLEDWNPGRLYAANTLGAALGSLASGFVLIECVGLQHTIEIAVLGNALVMAIGLWLSRKISGAKPEVTGPEANRDGADPRLGARALLVFFGATGALALAGEVLWTRALTLMLGSSTYAFSSILIVYLVGIALGSWILAGTVRRMRHPERLLSLSIAAAGAWHVIAVALMEPLYAGAALVIGGAGFASGESVGAVCGLYAALLLLVLPPALLSGALFPVVTRLLGGDEGDRGGPIAQAYTWNTVGSIAGALLGGFVIAPLFVHFHAIDVLALGFAGIAGYALWIAGARRHPGVSAVTLLLIGAIVFSSTRDLGRPDLFVRMSNALRPGSRIVLHTSGLQGTTTVRFSGIRNEPLLLVNGIGMTVKAFVTKAMAHLPIVVHGGSEDTLVVCFGMGTTVRSALAHGGRVDVVELVPEVFRAFDYFYPDAEAVRRDPRVRMIGNDGRNFLLLTRKRYDVITVDPPPPIDGAGVNNLYSLEFLERVKEHLKPGGIAAHWIPAIHASSGVPDRATWGMLVETFRHVFPYVRAIRGKLGAGVHLLGSMQPIELDPARLAAALANPAVGRDMNEFAWDPLVEASFFSEIPLPAQWSSERPLLTDDRPALEFSLIRNARAGLLHTMLRFVP